MKARVFLATSAALVALSQAAAARPLQAKEASIDSRVEAVVKAMKADEKTILTHGIMALPVLPGASIPADAVPGAGYVPGIARLNIPALKETDASLGVAYVFGLRKDGATALPSGLAQAATWNPSLVRQGGAVIGSETRAKGFNVLLAGGANLTRDPRNGRTFEYLSEDPLLTGTLVGNAIAGIQSNNIISTIKHFALNGQETGRNFVDIRISDAAARESDLLAFQIGIEIGQPGSVMCAYNKVNGAKACESDYLLNQVLKRDWRYKGFVMSDWGAVTSLDAAANGLDQQSAGELDKQVYFGAPLASASADPKVAARVEDMNRRIIRSIYVAGLDRNPVAPGGKIDFAANSVAALETAKQGIVLLKNDRNLLPLSKSAKRIAVIGGYANSGVISGGGSSQVQGEGGPAITIPLGGEGPFAAFAVQAYHRSAPVAAIKALAPQAEVAYRDGAYIADAVAQAKKSDVAIVFATKWSTEGMDQADLSLPNGQDELIKAVAAANPNTIVVLETGNPVDMPWLSQAGAVLEAWYPGARGGEAIASVLFGETNPSGRLPITFPASVSQLPRPSVDGYATLEPDFVGIPKGGEALSANYDIEGSDVGYRWFARKAEKPLFAFGYGLSYTTFTSGGLKTDGKTASFTLSNTGKRSGATVGQLYLVSRNGQTRQRLVGFQRVDLAPGASQAVTVTIDPRLLADWNGKGWAIASGEYGFALGEDAAHLGEVVKVRMAARSWKD